MKKWNLIVIHCSDSVFGNAAFLTRCHVLPEPQGRGWSNIGYHFVLLNGLTYPRIHAHELDGTLETGRPFNFDAYIQDEEIGAHATGFNYESIGVCLIGKDLFTKEQYSQLENLLIRLIAVNPDCKIAGHYQVDNKGKSCPNFNVPDYLALIGLEKHIYNGTV